MTWVKLDDQLPEHPKAEDVSPAAMWLFTAGLCYCSRQLTDGRIPKSRVPRLTIARKPEELAAELVTAGFWTDQGDAYLVHDYLDYQPSRSQVESQRASQRDRQAKSRSRRAVSAGTPTRPDPTPDAVLPTDHYQTSPDGPSSWSDDQAFIEAGRVAARSYAGTFTKGFDHYATGAASKIRQERGWMLPKLRDRGFTLEQTAAALASKEPLICDDDFDSLAALFADPEFTPADQIGAA